jgi:hypothetical protein
MRNQCKILNSKLNGTERFGEQVVNGRIILKCTAKDIFGLN